MKKNIERRDWLKGLRKNKGLTVRQIAPLLDVSWTHYSDIENGRKNPSLQLAIRMSKFLEFEVDKLA
jgi:putative transcriptional regulator